MEEASPSTSWIPCALATGCTLHAWHKGMCNIVLNKKCREKKQATIWVAADEPQQKKRPRADGEGGGAPKKKKAAAPPKRKPRKRKKDKEPDRFEPDPPKFAAKKAAPKKAKAAAPARVSARGGTRSSGAPVWDASSEEVKPVAAALNVGANGRVELSLTVQKLGGNKGLAALRDYLGQGSKDPFANASCASVSAEELCKMRGGKIIQWGCVCKGWVAKGGMELTCNQCHLTFHTKCERLDYTPAELQDMADKDTFTCGDCEVKERVAQGYDPALGRFIWQCKYCTRTYVMWPRAP